MKKNLSILMLAATLLLAGCDRGKSGLEQALAENFRDDQDLKDYKIDPDEMAECVADEIAGSIPGLPGAPQRKAYFEAYTKMIKVTTNDQDPQQVLEENQEVFGSIRKAREAAFSVTAHILDCIGTLVEQQGAP
jgi:hypothetical protein